MKFKSLTAKHMHGMVFFATKRIQNVIFTRELYTLFCPLSLQFFSVFRVQWIFQASIVDTNGWLNRFIAQYSRRNQISLDGGLTNS